MSYSSYASFPITFIFFLLRIFDFGILKLLSCKSTFSAKFIFIPYKSWSFLATFIFIFLITQIQTSVGDLTWRSQSANCRRDPSLSDQYHFQKDPPSISLPHRLELKYCPCSHCKLSGEEDRRIFPSLFPVLVFHLQLLVLELLSDAGTGEVSRVEQRYLQIDRCHCDRGGHVGYVGHLDRCRCDRQWPSRRGRTKYIWTQLRDEDCLENCLSNFPTFICMYAIMHPGAHNYTDKSMCTRELVIADAKWCSVHCPPATLLVQNFSPAPWWQTINMVKNDGIIKTGEFRKKQAGPRKKWWH